MKLSTASLTVVLVSLFRGWLLMLAVPLAHIVLGIPRVHPGLWPCVLLATVVGFLRIGVVPNAVGKADAP